MFSKVKRLSHFFLADDPSPNDEPEFQYYMNEGVYGSFASKLTEMQIATPSAHKVNLALCQNTVNYKQDCLNFGRSFSLF